MSKLHYDITDIEDTARNGEYRGAEWLRSAINKALEEELEHATVRRSKDATDETYDAGYRAAIQEAIEIVINAKAAPQ
jgi:hypothetical protein